MVESKITNIEISFHFMCASNKNIFYEGNSGVKRKETRV